MIARPGPGFRAVAGVGINFSSNGLVFAALLPWYPSMVEKLGLSSWEFGLIVGSFALGAIASSVMPATLISRFGANSVIVGSTVLLGASAALTAWSVNGWMMAACLFLVGFFDAIADVAQNVVGIAVQESLSRTILSSMHALWSLGGLLSGAAATFAASVGMDVRAHMGIVAIVAVMLVILARRMVGRLGETRHSEESARAGHEVLVDEEADVDEDASNGEPTSAGAFSRSKRAIVLMALPLAIVAVCGTALEDIANNWAALAAVELGGLSVTSAGIAFSIVIGSQCLGRFSGDLLVQRFGPRRIARLGGVFITLGGVAVVASVEPVMLLLGLAMIGYGSATLVPGALSAASQIPGVGRAAGVTLVNWIMRIGFLATSPLVGVVAAVGGLRWGLSLLILVGLITMIFAGRLGPSKDSITPV